MNPRNERKCRSCGEHKVTVENFKILPSGKRYNRCNDCVNSFKQTKRKCNTCGVSKTKDCYTMMPSGKVNPKCNQCRYNGREHRAINKLKVINKSKIKKEVKKDDLIIHRNILSFERKNDEKLSAIEALQKAKELEKKSINNGAKFVKYGIRAYVLKS